MGTDVDKERAIHAPVPVHVPPVHGGQRYRLRPVEEHPIDGAEPSDAGNEPPTQPENMGRWVGMAERIRRPDIHRPGRLSCMPPEPRRQLNQGEDEDQYGPDCAPPHGTPPKRSLTR